MTWVTDAPNGENTSPSKTDELLLGEDSWGTVDILGSFIGGRYGAVRRVASDPQAAINNASPGDTLVGDGSTFTLTSPLEVTTSRLTLKNLDLKLADGVDDVALYIHNCQDVVVKHCTIDGNEANNTQTTNETVNGVTVTNATRVVLADNIIKNTVSQGILFTTNTQDSSKASGDLAKVVAARNVVDNCGNGGILFVGGANNISRHGLMIQNELTNIVNEGLQAIDGWEHAHIIRNRVEVTGTSAVALENHQRIGTKATRDVWIKDNELISDANVIEVSHPNLPFYDIRIIGNKIDASGGGNGIVNNTAGGEVDAEFEGLEIRGNVFIGGGSGTAIAPQTADQAVDIKIRGVELTENKIENFNAAVIKEDGAPRNAFQIVGNRVQNCTYGFLISDSKQCMITYNYFEDISSIALSIREDQSSISSPEDIFGCHITDNVVRQPNVSGDNGIFQIGNERHSGRFDYAVVKNNQVEVDDPSTPAIEEQSTLSNSIIKDNLSVQR